MEPFIVSARKYRPTQFKDVVGQQAITNTLESAIDNDHLAQALLFTGPRGVGKTTCARILAKRINQDGTEKEDEDFAFNIFELDAASNNSVDDIRNLIDQVRIPPQVGKYKVYIIDEVHMLSSAAFNAFLKTLEEPPNHAIFILATTEKHKIIPTILSRCQIFDFRRITVKDTKNHLANVAMSEGINADDDALHIIAQKADGALRDALSIFDRVVSFSGNQLTREAVTENLNVLDYTYFFQVTDLLLINNIPSSLVLFNDILSKGFDGHHFIMGLASHFRDLLVCKSPETIQLLEVGDQVKQMYLEQSKKTTHSFLIDAIKISNNCDLKYKTSRNQRLLIELCLMQLASITFTSKTLEEKKKSSLEGNVKVPFFVIPPSHYKIQSTLIEKPLKASSTVSKKEQVNNSLKKEINTDVKPLLKKYNIEDKVTFSGYVDEYKLKLLYSEADTFFMTSLINAGPMSTFYAMLMQCQVITTGANADVKFSVWTGTTYGIGMTSGVTYGHLNDYAMTFCMNNDSDRGFWWGYSGQTKSDGAMSLTTAGKLKVKSTIEAQEITAVDTILGRDSQFQRDVVLVTEPSDSTSTKALVWEATDAPLGVRAIPTNNNQLTNGAGYTTNTGTLTGNGAANRIPYYSGTTTLANESTFTYTASSDKLTVGNISLGAGSAGIPSIYLTSEKAFLLPSIS